MSFSSLLSSVLPLAALLFFSNLALAEDVLRRFGPLQDTGAAGHDYAGRVLDEAMRRTRSSYGAYRIETRQVPVGREEQLRKMLLGDEVNVSVVATQPSWELQLLPIYIAPDMGLSNYRIALTTAEVQPKLSAVGNLDQLRALRVGVGEAWSSRRVLEIAGFAVYTEESAKPLVARLLAGKIDYFPRGLNEVFAEFDELRSASPNLRVEQDILLKFPLPGYVFVSPAHPRLHKRLSAGLESMVRDGSLLRMLKQHYADVFKRARLCERRVFLLENYNLLNPKPLQRKELWFDAFDPRSGVCKKTRKLS
ncbi:MULTISPECIES: hypothetical protein [unclassified Uliginosibacterium]|uniref:hypothetical protein n=1 Tax=unclassified Uliginosibacterium TaxID=2621521 RepID=UPI000C7E2268|nr:MULTISPECIES: hypothetical protein [unclassified Uliginosibacterium]MDO6385701.1 hypothetical protein [Uliginosibacterium sp. 31-12]PLK49729.1 hypothetical protein C0V76_04710 [Uliginosibacterium sp. TH139]